MTAELTRWLDELEAAREDAAPGPWQARSLGEIVRPCRCSLDGCTVQVALMDDGDGDEARDEANAELAVAAVNALPRLTAAVRAVLDLADEWGGAVDEAGCAEPRFRYAADKLRAAITDAAGGGQP